jgi:hypothetical protein
MKEGIVSQKDQRDKIVADLKQYAATHHAEYFLVVWTPKGTEKGTLGEMTETTSVEGERGVIVAGEVDKLLPKLF